MQNEQPLYLISIDITVVLMIFFIQLFFLFYLSFILIFVLQVTFYTDIGFESIYKFPIQLSI